jgi:hypothetical protein
MIDFIHPWLKEKRMFINKLGHDHFEMNKNNQDYGFINNDFKIKCVVDGCSEGEHSEVGAKLFCHFYNDSFITIESTFDRLVGIFGNNATTMMNFLCFTTLIVVEKDDWFEVLYCGDGYIIKEKLDGTIEFEKIDDGDYPKYYVYNYIDKSRLSAYKDGVTFSSKIFYKDEYKNIGSRVGKRLFV